jgi:hypothetical protein
MNSIRHTILALVMSAMLALAVGCGGASHPSTGETTDRPQSAGSEGRTHEKSSQKPSAEVQHRAAEVQRRVDQQPSTPDRPESQSKQQRSQSTAEDKQRAGGVVEALLDKTTDSGGQAETRVGADAHRILEEALEQGKAGSKDQGKPSESAGDQPGIVDQLLQGAVKQR